MSGFHPERFRRVPPATKKAKPALPKGPRIHRQLAAVKLMLRSLEVDFTEEHCFHPQRKWRFDLAIPSLKIAIEYQGHGQTGKNKGTGSHIGGHATITGFSKDCEKDLAATLLGWRVLKLTALHFKAIDRAKHKLTAPLDALKSLISQTP